jgi:ParB family transcriptional regulator, chromosome partitioning protein
MATTAAETAGHPAEKEKVEKRRALGRGLESLLPGPRVVAGPAVSAGVVPRQAIPGQGTGAAAKAEVPFGELRAGSHFVRDDNTKGDDKAQTFRHDHGEVARDDKPHRDGSAPIAASADASVVAEMDTSSRAAVSAPHLPAEGIEIHAQAEGRMPSNLVLQLPLDQIDANPHQTRYDFNQDNLEELAFSIKANGVVQPVVVRPGEEGRYILVLGERRCRASKLAGKTTVPAIVRRVSEQQAAEMTVIENLQREDLNCLEQAAAFAKLSRDFGMTQQQIGERVGLSRESISNYMRLLKLPGAVLEYLTYNKLSFGQARELLALENPELITRVADEAVKKNLTDVQVEDLVAKLNGWPSSNPGLPEPRKGGARWMDPNVRSAQMELERVLGLRVRIRDRKGKGKIVIEYATVDDYERVVEALRGKKG